MYGNKAPLGLITVGVPPDIKERAQKVALETVAHVKRGGIGRPPFKKEAQRDPVAAERRMILSEWAVADYLGLDSTPAFTVGVDQKINGIRYDLLTPNNETVSVKETGYYPPYLSLRAGRLPDAAWFVLVRMETPIIFQLWGWASKSRYEELGYWHTWKYGQQWCLPPTSLLPMAEMRDWMDVLRQKEATLPIV